MFTAPTDFTVTNARSKVITFISPINILFLSGDFFLGDIFLSHQLTILFQSSLMQEGNHDFDDLSPRREMMHHGAPGHVGFLCDHRCRRTGITVVHKTPHRGFQNTQAWEGAFFRLPALSGVSAASAAPKRSPARPPPGSRPGDQDAPGRPRPPARSPPARTPPAASQSPRAPRPAPPSRRRRR